jgi:hypothetical protein
VFVVICNPEKPLQIFFFDANHYRVYAYEWMSSTYELKVYEVKKGLIAEAKTVLILGNQ